MKKWILSAVVILALNGYAAAQTASKNNPKAMAKTENKGISTKNGTEKKEEVQKEPLTQQKLAFSYAAADTACVPVRKQD